MPSTSKKQHNFMAAAAHNPAFAKKAGISQNVAKEFNQADKGRKFRSGGMKPVDMKKNPGVAKLPTAVRNKMGFMKDGGMAHSDVKMDKKVVKKAVGMHDKQQHGGKKTNLTTLKKGGMSCAPKKMAKGGGIESKGKTKGTMIKMKNGGKAC
jgi:hypothetical protein